MDEPLRETSFLQDKLNQPEISGDLMSGRSAKSQIFEREIWIKKEPGHFWWIVWKCIKRKKNTKKAKKQSFVYFLVKKRCLDFVAQNASIVETSSKIQVQNCDEYLLFSKYSFEMLTLEQYSLDCFT